MIVHSLGCLSRQKKRALAPALRQPQPVPDAEAEVVSGSAELHEWALLSELGAELALNRQEC